jgi:hypothetical protein
MTRLGRRMLMSALIESLDYGLPWVFGVSAERGCSIDRNCARPARLLYGKQVGSDNGMLSEVMLRQPDKN